MVTEIPVKEREERIKKIQDELVRRDLDAYLVHSTEIDFGNVLYLSNHWSIWETLGVIIPKEGEPILLIGPEAEGYAKSRSTIKKIRKMLEYRESAEPEYPDIPLTSFEDIFDEISGGKGVKKLGLGDYTILPMVVYDSVRRALGKDGTIIRAENIISNLRMVKK
ncbi:MAG: aminopeptidase P family N-terminal domain-containing protein [Actinobacteria bacterium]|nr:aminopeptidase P family N-terminal domain-containing protein [Actinomycetota bacterium]